MDEQEKKEKPQSPVAQTPDTAPKDTPESSASETPKSTKKSRRRSTDDEGTPSRRRAWVVGIVAVLIVAGLIGVSYWAYQTVTARRLAEERLSRATQLVEDADVVVIEVDEIVRMPIEVAVGVRAEAALDMVPDAEDDLEEALSLIALAEPVLSEEDLISAEALADSAEARLEMLTHGAEILEANVKAAASMGHALAGWDAIIESEELSDTAVKEYNKLTDAAVKQSKKLAGDAKKKAQDAAVDFTAAQDAFPEVDFAAYIAYADGKADALAISIKADDAYLADKPTDANKFNDQYNAAEKELIAMAKALPSSPVEPIKIAYEALAVEATEAYYQARDMATTSDAQLQGGDDDAEE